MSRVSIGSDNGMSPIRRQAIISTSARLLSIGPLGTNFSEIVVTNRTFSFKKMRLKMSPTKWRPFIVKVWKEIIPRRNHWSAHSVVWDRTPTLRIEAHILIIIVRISLGNWSITKKLQILDVQKYPIPMTLLILHNRASCPICGQNTYAWD